MKKLIILNHKMNLEYDQIGSYIQEINKIETNNNIIVCPTNIYLADFMNYCTWGVGAQNISEHLDGNYTGEVSTLQLKSLGVEYSIIGHYERKKYFKETNKQIKDKLNACIDANISPILCFGETGKVDDAINALEEILEGIDKIEFIIFAYEPLKVADNTSISDVQSQVKEIYNYLYDKYSVIPNIVYGGGISRKDIHELLDNSFLNGIMIGKVSSDVETLKKVVNELKN